MYHKSDMIDFDEFQVNNSSHTKGTIYLVNVLMGAKGIVFERGHMDGRYKTHNSWYLGLVVPVSFIVGLLMLYS